MNTESIINIITVIITSLTLITTAIQLFIHLKKDTAKLEALSADHKDLNSETRNLSKEHQNLSKEHQNLSKEHQNLSKELAMSTAEIQKELINVRAFQEKEEELRKEAARHLPAESQFSILTKEIFEHNRALVKDKEELKEKNLVLQQRISELQQELANEKNENITLNNELRQYAKMKRKEHDEYEL